MSDAVDSRTLSGPVPLLPKDTSPSENRPKHWPAPTTPIFRRVLDAAVEDTVSPPRESDATKLSIPLPYMVTVITLALAGAAGVWRIENKVSVITTTIEYERELDRRRERELDQRFAALEAKIEAAGLRNFNMAISQELQKAQDKLKGR